MSNFRTQRLACILVFCLLALAQEHGEGFVDDVVLEERYDWNLRPPRPKPKPNEGDGGGGSGGNGGDTISGPDDGSEETEGGSSTIIVGGPLDKEAFDIFSDIILTQIETILDCYSQ